MLVGCLRFQRRHSQRSILHVTRASAVVGAYISKHPGILLGSLCHLPYSLSGDIDLGCESASVRAHIHNILVTDFSPCSDTWYQTAYQVRVRRLLSMRLTIYHCPPADLTSGLPAGRDIEMTCDTWSRRCHFRFGHNASGVDPIQSLVFCTDIRR